MFNAADIEDAFLAALAPLADSHGVKTLETYAGQLNIEQIEDAVVRFPAVFIAWTGGENAPERIADLVTCKVALVVAASNLRGEAEARRGATGTAGVYALLLAARLLLHRKAVIRGWTVATWLRDVPVAVAPDKGIAVYASHYTLKRPFTG